MLRLAAGPPGSACPVGRGRETVLLDTDSDSGLAPREMLLRTLRKRGLGVTIVQAMFGRGRGPIHVSHTGSLKQSQMAVYTGAETLSCTRLDGSRGRAALGETGVHGSIPEDPAAVETGGGAALTGRKPARSGHPVPVIGDRAPSRRSDHTRESAHDQHRAGAAAEAQIETQIRRIVFMGGNVRVPGECIRRAEFNFWFDPEAARIVLRRDPER